MNITSFLESKQVKYRLASGNREAKITCPSCGGEDKLYISTQSGAFHCFRASCSIEGGPGDLVKIFGEEWENGKIEIMETPQDIPDPDPIPLDTVDDYHRRLLGEYNSLEEYFTNKRGFTKDTISQFKLGWDGRNILIPIYDERGNCVNFKHKPDPTRPNPSKGMFSISGRGRMRLFNASVLMGDQKPTEVIICEGEWDCIKLIQEGYVAVSSTGGAGSFKSEWLPLFQGVQKIYICQDNDINQAGQSGSKKIEKLFNDQKIKTYMVNLPNPRPGREEKIDVSDFFNSLGKSKEHFDLLLQTAQPYLQPESEKKYRLADRLCEIAVGAGVRVFLSSDEPHVILPEEPLVAYPLARGKFRGWLKARYWELQGVSFNGEIYKDVVETLSAKAYHEGKNIQLWNRVAMINNTVYYDMGDGQRVVQIDKTGWEVITKAPVMFKRIWHQLPQVEPDPNGDLAEVSNFVNLRNDRDRLLLLTYLISGLNPTIPRVLLTIHGDQGSAKSTTLRVVRSILDPSNAGPNHPSKAGNLISPPKDDLDLAGKSMLHYCLYFDNLSDCPDWMSDAFARLITGATISKRKLYTDSDEVTFSEMPLLGMTGINMVAEKPDLLQRLLILELERISPNTRKTEKVFWDEFIMALPKILGGLFTALSKTLLLVDGLRLNTLPRMADYAHFATAAAISLGSTQEDFLYAYNQNIERQNQSVIDSSPVMQTIIQFMEDKTNPWEGPSTHLFSELQVIAADLKLSVGGRDGFPKDPKWLWKKIKMVKTNLADMGIEVSRRVTKTNSLIQLTNLSMAVESVTSVTTDTSPPLLLVGNNDGNKQNGNSSVTKNIDASDVTDVTEVTYPSLSDSNSLESDVEKILGYDSSNTG